MATKSELGLLPNTQDEVLEGNVLELGQGPDFDEQNSQIFEVNHPFVNQSADEVIGRMDWLLSNSKAEFLLTLRELGLSSRQIVGVYGAFEEITDDFEDFVSAGLEGHEGPDSEVDDTEHPSQYSLDESLDNAFEGVQVEALGDIHAEGRVFSSVLKGGRTATRLGMMGGDLKKYLLDQSFPNVPDDIIDLDY